MPLMPPTTGPALIILVAFVLPGFVTVMMQEHVFKLAEDPTPLDRLLRIIVYSVWSYLLVAVAAMLSHTDRADILREYHRYTPDPAQLVWRGALLVLVTSTIVAFVTWLWSRWGARKSLLERVGFNPRHTEATAWDFFFRQGQAVYVKIRLTTGEQLAGYYGSESFAAYARDGRDLFLEQACDWDEEAGWFGDPVEASCGVWINPGNAVAVEFYNPGQDETSVPQDADYAAVRAAREEERASSAETAGETTSAASEEARQIDGD